MACMGQIILPGAGRGSEAAVRGAGGHLFSHHSLPHVPRRAVPLRHHAAPAAHQTLARAGVRQKRHLRTRRDRRVRMVLG